MDDNHSGRVLIVDDDEALTEVYAAWVSGRNEVETATSGEAALHALDEDVAVVLLDRRMPGLPGEDVLEVIRDRGYDCRVAMVTGVRPDADVVDMGFDEYLVKPVTQEDILATVDRLRERTAYSDRLQTYYALASKRAALERERALSGASDDIESAIQTLDARLASVQAEMARVVDSFDTQDFRVAFRDVAAGDDD